MAGARIQITEMQTQLTQISIPCSRCGENPGAAWAFPIDFYEQRTWASHRLVCRRCADELSDGQAWEARRAPRRQRSHEEDAAVNRDLERAAIDLFIPLYNAKTGRGFTPLRLHEEENDQPDAVLEATDGGQLGLEVTHLGYSYNRGEHSSGAPNELAFLLDRVPATMSETQASYRLIEELNAILADKAKTYASIARDYPVALLVRVANPLFTASSFDLYGDDIVVSAPSPFSEIWLLPRDDEGSGWSHTHPPRMTRLPLVGKRKPWDHHRPCGRERSNPGAARPR